MPKKAKTEETVVTKESVVAEETAIMENASVKPGNFMEDTSLSEGENLMDDRTYAGDAFLMDGGLPDHNAIYTDEKLSAPDESAVGNVVSAPEHDIMDGNMLERTSYPEENAKTETETEASNNSEIELQPKNTTVNNTTTTPPLLKKRKSKASATKPDLATPVRKPTPSTILTLNADTEVETPESREDIIWHELQNAYRTRKILTGILGGIEKMDGGGTVAVIYYKEMRVAIPLAEMMINLVEDEAHNYGELVQRQNKILGNMLGCEIDFIIKGLENTSRSVVASRKDAMYKKRQIFYMPDANGNSRVCEDRIVQARVIAVAEKVVRVEIFGVECSILARDLSWDWLGDATERFHVGEQILVRILSVKVHSLEEISVKADVKSVSGNTSKENLGRCKIQGKYAGTVTDIHKGTVFVRLHIGVNAVAHSCYDNRMPGKKDEISFVVTRIDAERNVAVGLISRIIKQNI